MWGEVQDGHQEGFLHWNCGQSLEKDAKGGGAATVSGVFKKRLHVASKSTSLKTYNSNNINFKKIVGQLTSFFPSI